MKDLHKYLINPFDDDGISIGELLSFTTDHQQKMVLNNPGGIWNSHTIPTSIALTNVSNLFTDDKTKLGLRKARKLAKNNFRAALPVSIGKLAVAVEAKFGEGSPEFVECFPEGRTVFTKAQDDELGNYLQTLINGVTAHQPPLDLQVVTDATALLTGWNLVYAPSEQATAAKATTVAAKAAARAALQKELFLNLLAIAQNYPGQPDKVDVFMQMSLLEDPTPATPTPPPTPPGP